MCVVFVMFCLCVVSAFGFALVRALLRLVVSVCVALLLFLVYRLLVLLCMFLCVVPLAFLSSLLF